MKKLFKIGLLLIVLPLIFITYQTDLGQTKTRAYYSGDAINYNGKLIVASTDSSYLELFRLDGKKLIRTAKFKASNSRDFYTVMLKQELGNLYAYASTGHELYKYNITNPRNIVLVNKINDNSGDWFGGLAVDNGYLITKGSKNLKFWNGNMKVVDTFKVVNQTNPYNIVVGTGYKYIFNIKNNNLEVFDRQKRTIVKRIPLVDNKNNGNIKIYNDATEGMIYVPDGQQLKKYNYLGYLYKSINHDSGFGYDVVPSLDNKYIYFSNGVSIKKLDKIDLHLVSEFHNRVDLGYWAMGLKVASDDQGEKVVVFNNASITIFDSNLKIVAYVYGDEQERPTKTYEKLFLNVNQKSALPFEWIVLKGGGFAQNEPVKISLGTQKMIVYSNQNGRFIKKFVVGPLPAERLDIKAVGQNSGQHYSISFEIKSFK